MLAFIERHRLHGLSVSYVDAHLLVGAKLTRGSMLWSLDQRLDAVAARLDIGFSATA